MKDDFEKAIGVAVETKNVNYFGKFSLELATKYKVSKKTVHNRFHSMYGCAFQDYVRELIIPSKEEVLSAVLNSSTPEEFYEILGRTNRVTNGLFDKYFGVSTYKAVKLKLLKEAPVAVRKSQLREDNLAILMSQYLGDGSYNRDRHALRIIHGEKQGEYLRWKVGLLHEGYNRVSTEISLRTHKQGHKYYDYYSGQLGHVIFPTEKEKVVSLLTPLGWLLWYLDDGSNSGQDLAICCSTEAIANTAQKELETYGVSSRVSKAGETKAVNLTMRGDANSLLFYKNFLEPFLNIIPPSMLYKVKI